MNTTFAKLPTIYDIKNATLESAPMFFSKGNLKFAGQSIKSFTVRRGKSGAVYIFAPLWMDGRLVGTTVRRFTGSDLESVSIPHPVRDHPSSVMAWITDEG